MLNTDQRLSDNIHSKAVDFRRRLMYTSIADTSRYMLNTTDDSLNST